MDKRQETTFGNNPVTLLGTKVNVGDKAQDFTCLNAELKPVKLSDYDGKKYGFVMEEFRLLNRGIVILDENNEVKYVEYVKENTNHPDYDKAIEALKSL